MTVLLGSRLASGGSVSSFLLQLTLLPTAWTPCALERSSLQLQPLVEASSPGQAWENVGSDAESRSSISTRRPGSSEMPTPGANIVLRLGLTSAAPPPPVIPYLHHEASRECKGGSRSRRIFRVFNEWQTCRSSPSTVNTHHPVIPEIFSTVNFQSVLLCHGSPGAQLPLLQTVHKSKRRSYEYIQKSAHTHRDTLILCFQRLGVVLNTFRGLHHPQDTGLSRLPLSNPLKVKSRG